MLLNWNQSLCFCVGGFVQELSRLLPLVLVVVDSHIRVDGVLKLHLSLSSRCNVAPVPTPLVKGAFEMGWCAGAAAGSGAAGGATRRRAGAEWCPETDIPGPLGAAHVNCTMRGLCFHSLYFADSRNAAPGSEVSLLAASAVQQRTRPFLQHHRAIHCKVCSWRPLPREPFPSRFGVARGAIEDCPACAADGASDHVPNFPPVPHRYSTPVRATAPAISSGRFAMCCTATACR